MKTRGTACLQPSTQVGAAFVSNWVMYDTYQEEEEETKSTEGDASEASNDVAEIHQLTDSVSADSFRYSVDERQMNKLLKNPKFLEAISVTERLLANNCYNEQQKIFRGLTVQDDFRENIEYKYNLKLLWTFANKSTKGNRYLCKSRGTLRLYLGTGLNCSDLLIFFNITNVKYCNLISILKIYTGWSNN